MPHTKQELDTGATHQRSAFDPGTRETAEVERDKLAAELADIYPAFAQKLAELLPRIAANDRQVEHINRHLPSGAERLLVAELIARGLRGFVENSVQIQSPA